jgi:hypothetical protein
MSVPAGTELQCARCGAPLAWDGTTPNVTCQYCDLVAPMRPLVAPPAPASAPPAATVRPPVHEAPGDTAKALGLVLGGLLLLGLVVAVVAVSRGDLELPGAPGPAVKRDTFSVAEVTRVELATTPDQLAKRFGVGAGNDEVILKLRDAGFSALHFGWNKDHLEHVSSLTLVPPTAGMPATVVQRAKAELGEALLVPGVGISLGAGCVIHVTDFADPRWKQRMSALFTVLKGAGLGTADVLDERTKRDALNLGHPLGRLSEVDLGVPVESAEREVRRVIPGAVTRGEDHDVGVAHAWFRTAELAWVNAPRGKFARLTLTFAPGFDLKAQHDDLERCLKPLLGKPRVTVKNHLANEFTLSFAANLKRNPEVGVDAKYVTIEPPRGAKDPSASLKPLIDALASCR